MNCCLCRYCLTEGIHAGDVSADLSADGILVLTIRKLPQGLEFTERQLEQLAAEPQLEQPTAEQLPGTGSRCVSKCLRRFRESKRLTERFFVTEFSRNYCKIDGEKRF
jgi:hypothetical protein